MSGKENVNPSKVVEPDVEHGAINYKWHFKYGWYDADRYNKCTICDELKNYQTQLCKKCRLCMR